VAAERAAEATMAAEREATAREAAVRAMAEAETEGTCSVRHSRRSPCRRRTEQLRQTEQSGSQGHRPGTRCYWRTRTYWCTTSVEERAEEPREVGKVEGKAAVVRAAAVMVAAARVVARAVAAKAAARAAAAAVVKLAVAAAMVRAA
jgi:hypothetical protein